MAQFLDMLGGIAAAAKPEYLLYALIGALLGTLVGVLPGLGPASAVAILFPLTAVLPPTGAIIALAGIWYGAMYGGSTTAILLNIPGEVSSVTTAIDGYQMTRQGRAGPALAMAAITSFLAGTVGVVLLSFAGPAIATAALRFGPPEYLALTVLSLTAVISLAGPKLGRGIVMALAGLLLAGVGFDPISSAQRLVFDVPQLLGGFDAVAIMIGLFGISEVLSSVGAGLAKIYSGRLGRLWPRRDDFVRGGKAGIRGTAVGFALGLLPGMQASVASFLSYDVEKRVAKRPERFGKGAIEGVAGPEAANNAAAMAGFIPMLSLGIPTSATTALLLAALVVYGFQAGPLLFTQHADFTWTVIGSMYIGNLMLLVLNLPLVGLWARVARIPYRVMGPVILVICVIGAYAIRGQMFDVWVALAFGVFGVALKHFGWPTIPFVLGLVLGPLLERGLRQSLSISAGDWSIFVTRPISATVLALAAATTAVTVLWRRRLSRKGITALEE
ncbi:tripartite tricarboxylate transporter permease [Phytohabitans sp. ZYX-F-186]|uniref:Tripartite tricarboxylate transporter permease n=1 Tax=Phytohabitans maris TaxID=3071409 RepID=A0ABU0ZSH0_9ACTN|nr:tripartite tricarboxylate transporter permease [Phytohabitans sp. ZYX-F-186]MDQ7909908.1 tripartite tricarboxylate transporter permease [Phytohabitans sp. ZYX-F-186]